MGLFSTKEVVDVVTAMFHDISSVPLTVLRSMIITESHCTQGLTAVDVYTHQEKLDVKSHQVRKEDE